MASLGSLVIELAANTARLQSDMGRAVAITERAASNIKRAFGAVGGVLSAGIVGSAITNAAKNAIKLGDDLQKAAQKAGIGGKAMSELAYAAKLADVEVSGLSTAIKKMQVSLSEAGSGSKAPLQTLDALGLTFEKLQKMKPEDQFALIGDRISKLKDPADRARAAVEIFGKAGADLLPLFADGAEGLAKLRNEAEKLGFSFDDAQLKKLADADDAMKRLDASWNTWWLTITSKVAPALTRTLDILSGIDSRPLAGQMDGRIKELQNSLSGLDAGYLTPGSPEAARRERERAELDSLIARRKLLDAPKLSDPGSRTSTFAPGFAASAAADAAEEAADKERKAQEKLVKEMEATRADLNAALLADTQEMLEEEYSAYLEQNELIKKATEEREEDARRVQEANAARLRDTAAVFKDAFLNAWDDMVNTGKIKWDELLKYILAEFARRGIAKLFDQIFSSSSSSGGWASVLSSLFGGGKAAGGAVSQGKFYAVGENGPELFAPGVSGSIIPNHAMGGGGVVITQHNVFNNPTRDILEELPRLMRRNNESLKADIIDGIQRGRYAI